MAYQIAPSGQYKQLTAIPAFGPIEFKQHLLAAFDDEGEIADLLSMWDWDKIVILQFQGKEYVLISDVEVLPRSDHLSILLILIPLTSL